MKHYRAVIIIGTIEILIGSITLLTTFGSVLLNLNQKPLNVLIFVVVTASISTIIGVGILKRKKSAYQLLLYFSSVIILSKIFIALGIIELTGALEVSIHKALKFNIPHSFDVFMTNLKNSISVIYHCCVIVFLMKREIRGIFLK